MADGEEELKKAEIEAEIEAVAKDGHETMQAFGYPETLVHEYDHWVVLVRPDQITLGTLVLICKEAADAFAEVSAGAFGELKQIIEDIEATLKGGAPFGCKKMNYLMLMMKDPQVHYHVVPRYLAEQSFDGVTFADPPGPPNMAAPTALKPTTLTAIQEALKNKWPKPVAKKAARKGAFGGGRRRRKNALL